MYKKTEKKIHFLLDKVLLNLNSTDKPLPFYGPECEIERLLKENKDLLTTDMQEKVLEILSKKQSLFLLKVLQSKDYQHLGYRVVKLLDLSEPFFSSEIIETLYKMGTYQFVDEIRPFATLSIDDKMPFSNISYRIHEFYIGGSAAANYSFQYLNDAANKYIKRANKLKAKLDHHKGNNVFEDSIF